MKTLAIIAARGGSKGLPGKNIADCAGRPLIAWTIQSAQQARLVDRILISTDSEAIAEAARACGAAVPWLRPAELAEDDTEIEAVIRHALDQTAGEYDLLCYLQPTSPLRRADHIDQAISRYRERATVPSTTLVSVVAADPKALWVLQEDEEGYVSMPLQAAARSLRRQALPNCFFPNGAIYIAPCSGFCGFYTDHTLPFVMDRASSIDVDTKEDLARAAALLESRSRGVAER
jgi:N-acylneuraminate cytidylyltransferase